MSTVVVYVLVFWIGAGRAGGPTVIDNISSADNCQAMRVAIERDYADDDYNYPVVVKSRCYAVRKIIVK